MAITQNITSIPKAGKRGVDTRDSFVLKQEAFQDALTDTFVTEINNFRTQANGLETNVNNKEASAIQAATTATTQAGIATAKAKEASTSAGKALTSRNQAETLKNQAGTFAQQAQESVESIDEPNIVRRTGNQTIAGVKTFSSSPIVPVPTTNFQSVPLRSTNLTVNVGTGQTYTTINQALEYLSGFYPMYKQSGVTATINLKAGFVMAEQVLVNGIDLGWITIVGEDEETIITHTALTTAFNGTTHFPVFGVDKGGTSPVIGQLFRFNVEKVGGGKHGLMTYGTGSSAYVLSGKGFIGAGLYGIVANNNSTIDANGANFSNAGRYGIYASEASTVNAEYSNCSNAGRYGIFASKASTVNAAIANCSNAGEIGIHARHGSMVNANGAIIQDQTTGTARVNVLHGSHILATEIDTTGGTVPVFSQAVNTLTSSGIIYQ